MAELSDYFRGQARWREMKAEEYPEDARNQQAARALLSLADWIDEQPTMLAHLREHRRR
jgi:hypothetical protein